MLFFLTRNEALLPSFSSLAVSSFDLSFGSELNLKSMSVTD